MDSATEKNSKEYNLHSKEWEESLSENIVHIFLEKPAMEAELPESLLGKKVLCVGVGTGDEINEIRSRKAESIVGIDASKGLLDIAIEKYTDVEFHLMDMNKLDFDDDTFDFVYSSLVFHYAKDLDRLLMEMNRVLKKDGILLFSIHHPEYWGTKESTGNKFVNDRGVSVKEHKTTLPGNIEIIYYNHDRVENITDAVENAGFEVEKSFIPSVVDVDTEQIDKGMIDKYKKLKQKNSTQPYFYIVKARKV